MERTIRYCYRLRKGDLLTSPVGNAVLLRETKGYWYYYFQDRTCRISKIRMWHGIDKGNVGVTYGSSMKYRRKKRKDRALDLHGVKHTDAEEKIRSYLNFVELPTTIITGSSEKMKQIVRDVAKEYGWSALVGASNNGQMIITEGEK